MIAWRPAKAGAHAVRWIILALAVLIVIAFLARWWDDVWDWLPWSDEQQLERAEGRTGRAELDAASNAIEVELRDKQAVDVAVATTLITETRIVTERAVVAAEGAPDAAVPIYPERAERLRDADRGLCELSPALCAP